jgi:mannosyltransferase
MKMLITKTLSHEVAKIADIIRSYAKWRWVAVGAVCNRDYIPYLSWWSFASFVVIVALAVRAYQLTYHSLWFDEAVSVYWARQEVPHIIQVSMNLVEDKLPPLYYLTLHFWVRWFGRGEVAVRVPSILAGTLLIPLLYSLGAELSDRRAGLGAALLAAVNPFLVWYSQEARMYALAALWAVASTLCFVKALRARKWGETGFLQETRFLKLYAWRTALAWWAGYVLCATAGLYTHLYTGFLLPAHALFYLLSWRRYREAWLRFGLALAAIALAFAPLAWANWRASAEAGPGNPLAGLGERLWLLLNAFTLHYAPLPGVVGAAIVALLTLLALIGIMAPLFTAENAKNAETGYLPWRSLWPLRLNSEGALCLALCTITPVLVADLLLLRSSLMFYGLRYFIVVTPFFLLAIAAGAARLGQRWPALGAATYLLALGVSLYALPYDWSPQARKEEWRGVVDYLATHARPDDAILIHPDFVRIPFQYYERGPGHAYAVFPGPLSAEAQVEPAMQKIVWHPVVWLVQSHIETPDPQRLVEGWLAARYPLITELYPPGVTLKGYAVAYRLPALPASARPLDAVFAGRLRLLGYTVDGERFRATDDLYHPPSGWIHVTLYWQATAPLEQDYTATVHLNDDLGQVWGAQLDRPGGAMRFYPPTRWEPGQVIRDDYDVNLNPATPPGGYRLTTGLLSAAGEQVPAVVDGAAADRVMLGRVDIVR